MILSPPLKRRLPWLALIVTLGLPLGYVLGGALFATDRAKAAITLFETYCLPLARGAVVAPGPELQPFPFLSQPMTWLAGDARLLIALTKTGRCSVFDDPVPLSQRDRTRLVAPLTALVESHLPDLSLDTNHGMDSWDAYLLWAQYPRFIDKRRWGVMLFRADATPSAETRIQLFKPATNDTAAEITALWYYP